MPVCLGDPNPQSINTLGKGGFTPEEIAELERNRELRQQIRGVSDGRLRIVPVATVGCLKNEFLRFTPNSALIISPTDGSEILANADDIFVHPNQIDADFRRLADERGSPTEETPVCVYEIAKDATFMQLFGSLSADVSLLCLTQAQIKMFVKEYKAYLRTDTHATFFLFQAYKQFFVARVNFPYPDRLRITLFRLGFSAPWNANLYHRLVAPQLAIYA